MYLKYFVFCEKQVSAIVESSYLYLKLFIMKFLPDHQLVFSCYLSNEREDKNNLTNAFENRDLIKNIWSLATFTFSDKVEEKGWSYFTNNVQIQCVNDISFFLILLFARYIVFNEWEIIVLIFYYKDKRWIPSLFEIFFRYFYSHFKEE